MKKLIGVLRSLIVPAGSIAAIFGLDLSTEIDTALAVLTGVSGLGSLVTIIPRSWATKLRNYLEGLGYRHNERAAARYGRDQVENVEAVVTCGEFWGTVAYVFGGYLNGWKRSIGSK